MYRPEGELTEEEGRKKLEEVFYRVQIDRGVKRMTAERRAKKKANTYVKICTREINGTLRTILSRQEGILVNYNDLKGIINKLVLPEQDSDVDLLENIESWIKSTFSSTDFTRNEKTSTLRDLKHSKRKISLSEIMNTGIGVCRHNALAFHTIVSLLGFTVITRRGRIEYLYDVGEINEENHIWNEVLLDNGELLLFDSTNPIIYGKTNIKYFELVSDKLRKSFTSESKARIIEYNQTP